MDYEKQLSRILPIPAIIINEKWSDEKVRVEAEKQCKPFCCAVQRCLARASQIKTDEEIKKCQQAPVQLERCVKDISDYMKEIIRNKIAHTTH